MLEIGPNLAAFLMALIPSIAILAGAVAITLHSRAVRDIGDTASDTNRKVSRILNDGAQKTITKLE